MPSSCEVCGSGKAWGVLCRDPDVPHRHRLCTPCKRYLIEGPMVPHRRGKRPRCPDTVTTEDRVALGLPVESEA
jgi:hypothetical protein